MQETLAALRKKANKGHHCFVLQDVQHRDELEYLIQQWQTKRQTKKDKGLVLLTVSTLSQTHKDFYHNQKNHYQTIANMYTNCYTCCKQFHKPVIASTFIVIHGKLILNSHQVRCWHNIDSLAVLVQAHLPRIH